MAQEIETLNGENVAQHLNSSASTQLDLDGSNSGSNKLKVLYVMRSFAHFIYHETTIESLLSQNAEVQIAFDEKWSAGRPDSYITHWSESHGLLPYIFFPTRRDKWRDLIFQIRELSTFASYLRRKGQSPFYLKRWERYLSPQIQKWLARPILGRAFRLFLRSPIAKMLFSLIEKWTPASTEAIRFLEKINPDIVIVSPTNLRYSEEVEIVKATKKLKVPSVIPVLTWDNLTTKGLIHVRPDLLLAWNQSHAKEAQAIHRVPLKNITITGSPFFDKWFDRQFPNFDSSFYTRAGLKADMPFVTYLGSSANIAPDESGLVTKLAQGFKSRPEMANWQILVRAHPANSRNFLKVTEDNVAFWPKPLEQKGELGLPETDESLMDFKFALSCSECIIGINTSAMIEGIINDKPVIALLLKAFAKTQEEASHFQHLLESDVLYLATSVEQAFSIIDQLKRGIDPKKPNRQNFVRSFVRANENSAGKIQADAILSFANQMGKQKLNHQPRIAPSHP